MSKIELYRDESVYGLAGRYECHHQEQMNPFSKSGWTHPEVVSFDVSVRVTLIQGPCSCCERGE